MVLDRGLIFQPVLASLPDTQTCTYNGGAIITLRSILTEQTFHQNYFKKYPPQKNNNNNNNNNKNPNNNKTTTTTTTTKNLNPRY